VAVAAYVRWWSRSARRRSPIESGCRR
jgi:hypothetical protein